jgi:hypothetical protein
MQPMGQLQQFAQTQQQNWGMGWGTCEYNAQHEHE